MAFHDNIVAAVPRKVYANAHAYHINSISLNSDGETYMSADDLRINLWNLNISDQSFSESPFLLASLPKPRCYTREVLRRLARVTPFRFDRRSIQNLTVVETMMLIHSFIFLFNFSASDILDIKPANMEELTEVITAAEFHPTSCNLFCYSSSKGTVKLADMRDSALCDRHAKSGSSSPLLLKYYAPPNCTF